MTTTITDDFRRTCFRCLVLAAGALASSVALAEEPQPQAQVTIRADRPTSTVAGYTSTGVPIVTYQLQYHVSYTDLDIATKVGSDALKARVYKAADMLCKDLDKLYPQTAPDGSCVRKAEDGAMAQVNNAVKLAQAGKNAAR